MASDNKKQEGGKTMSIFQRITSVRTGGGWGGWGGYKSRYYRRWYYSGGWGDDCDYGWGGGWGRW